jgi:hypothetical protein
MPFLGMKESLYYFPRLNLGPNLLDIYTNWTRP